MCIACKSVLAFLVSRAEVIASAPRDLVHRGSIYVFNDVYESEVLELNGEEVCWQALMDSVLISLEALLYM